MTTETLTSEIVYSLLLMSLSGLSACWARYILENKTVVRVSAAVGVTSAIFMILMIYTEG